MSYLLRQIDGAKWLKPKNIAQDSKFPADLVTDLQTANNTLSVYLIDKDTDIEKSIIAIASKKFLKEFTFALIKLSDVEKDFTIKPTTSKSPFEEADSLHYDFLRLTANDLIKLAMLIHNKAEKDTKTEPEVRDLLEKSKKKLNFKMMPHQLHKEFKIPCGFEYKCPPKLEK